MKILSILLMYILFVTVNVSASELDEPSSIIQEESSEEESLTPLPEDAAADAELLLFGYMDEPEEANVTLARIYNLLLTFLYVYIINIGRQIIMRVLRKGQTKHGFFN